MKIAHIFKTYFPDTQGGLEEAIRQISEYTTAQGVENRIFTVSPTPGKVPVQFNEARVNQFKTTIDIFSTPMSYEFFKKARGEIEECDIIHFHFPWPFAEILFLLQRYKKPALVTYHADILKFKLLKFFIKPVINQFLSKVDSIVTTSQSFLDSSIDLQPFRDKCRVIHLSIGNDRFNLNGQGNGINHEKVLKKVESEVGRDFFLFVGVLRDYKGLEYLIKAMKGLDNKLVIIGKGQNKEKLIKTSEELGLKNVHFPGFVDDTYLQAYLKLCKAFILPSIDRSEAFGVSLLEASYFSKPMISTELGTGTSFVNKHLETGLVVPPGNIRALQKAMCKLSNDNNLCGKLGANAKKRYEALFVPEITGKEYLKLYDELLQKHSVLLK